MHYSHLQLFIAPRISELNKPNLTATVRAISAVMLKVRKTYRLHLRTAVLVPTPYDIPPALLPFSLFFLCPFVFPALMRTHCNRVVITMKHEPNIHT